MFLDELTPIVKELVEQPVAFLGGFFSGMLRLNLNDDPVGGKLRGLFQGFGVAWL